MREIKFRGFTYKTGQWLYGNLIEKDDPEWRMIHLISWAVLRDRENRLKLEDIKKTEP
jgi:hypothetical protein